MAAMLAMIAAYCLLGNFLLTPIIKEEKNPTIWNVFFYCSEQRERCDILIAFLFVTELMK